MATNFQIRKLNCIFEAHEFEMILNGLSFISLDDWEVNSVYLGVYHAKH